MTQPRSFGRENPLSRALPPASPKNPYDPGQGGHPATAPWLRWGSGPSSSCLKGFSGLPAHSLLYLWKPLKTSEEGLIQCEVLSLKKFV